MISFEPFLLDWVKPAVEDDSLPSILNHDQEAQWHATMIENVFQMKKSRFFKNFKKLIWFFLIEHKRKRWPKIQLKSLLVTESMYYLCKQKLNKIVSIKKSCIKEAYRVKCKHLLSPALTLNLLPKVTNISNFVWTFLVFCYVLIHIYKSKPSVYMWTNGIK